MTPTAQQTYSKPYFCFNPTDQKSAEFAEHLKACMGSFTVDESDIIVDIGGDGTILYAFQHLPNKPNFALKPPTSNSALFHGHHNITNADGLCAAFNDATLIEIPALKADVHMSDNTDVTVYAYSDVIISAFTAQAVLSNIQINGASSHRVMVGGLITATSLGSTARNQSCGGRALKLGSKGIVITSDGKPLEDKGQFFTFGDPANSRTESQDTTLDIKMVSPNKRPIIVHFDSGAILPDGQTYDGFPLTITDDRHIAGLTIRTDQDQARQLLLNENYRTHPSPS